ncbi:Krueppel-like factor 6 [Drosophila ficusphila]|uniref:Krueppel-like factor 6 n=1 Tax=Drosophila ficusphila TaxID=30025 RepID=UPI0007E7C26F|nr:Krueppel-like factor 6 [Drosophila ficusphila]
MDFFATGGFQQLYSDLDEEPLAGGDALLNHASVADFECSYVAGGFPSDSHHLEEPDYCGIITLDSNNNNNNNNNYNSSGSGVMTDLSYAENPSLFIDFNELAVCPPDLSDWEQRLLDNFVEIPELVDFLPERTPLCTDNCADFLEESNSNLRLAGPPPEILAPDRSPATSVDNSTPAQPDSSPTLQMSENAAGERGYLCTFGNCDKIYAKPAHLKAHLRRHLGEKPYVCSWPDCVWRFSRSDELARHKRSHSGVKPYKCDYCAKCFARSDHLTKHRKVHERRLLAASRAGRILSDDLYAVRPGRKRRNQL